MKSRKDGWLNDRTDGLRLDERIIDGWLEGWTGEQMDERMDGWMDGETGQQMDGWTG